MNLESKFKTALVSAIKGLGDDHYARRHEDRYALGLLDLSIKIPGYPHLEAEGKLVPHQKFAPTLRQWVEGENYRLAGGLCCLIGWSPSDKKMYIAPWGKEAFKDKSFHSDIGSHAEQLVEWLRLIHCQGTE